MTEVARVDEDRDLWAAQVAVLASAIANGKPGAIERVKQEIAKLDGKIQTLVNRRELIPQTLQVSLARAQQELDDFTADIERRQKYLSANGREAMVTAQISTMTARMADLAKLVAHVRVPPRQDDEGATPEQLARPSRRDSIRALEEAEREQDRISPQQAAAARRIACVFQAISAAGQARIGRMDGAGRTSGGGFRAPDMTDDLDTERQTCYLPWTADLSAKAPETLRIVTQVAVFGISLHAVRVHQKMSRANALGKLRDGLERYWDLYIEYRKLQQNT